MAEVPLPNSEEVTAMRERHVRWEPPEYMFPLSTAEWRARQAVCAHDQDRWPCDAARLLALEELTPTPQAGRL